jgi:hypothetical protein
LGEMSGRFKVLESSTPVMESRMASLEDSYASLVGAQNSNFKLVMSAIEGLTRTVTSLTAAPNTTKIGVHNAHVEVTPPSSLVDKKDCVGEDANNTECDGELKSDKETVLSPTCE